VYARVANYRDWIAGNVPGVRFVGDAGGGTQPPPDGDDHGDTPADATLVTGEGTITAQGVLDAGDRDVFRLDLGAGGRVTAVTSGSVDTYGTLSASTGAVIARDDDSGAGNNFSLAADASGTVYLEVRGYDARAVGPYTLTLTVPADTAEPDADFVLDLRTTTAARVAITDRLDAGVRDTYTVEVLSPGAATLSAGTTSGIDTFGTLLSETGAVLASDDDSGPSLDFSLSRAVSPGRYLLEVRGYDASAAGQYDLSVSATR
jgi:hypothetical protein